MKKSMVGVSTVLLVLSLSSAIPALGGGWVKTGESKGVTGYARPTPQSSLQEMMAVGVIDAPVADVEALLKDVPAQKGYMYLCSDAEMVSLPGKTNTGDSYCIYSKMNMPAPVMDRDSIICWEWSTDRSTGARFVHGEGVNAHYRLDKNVVRMTFITLDFTLTPKGPDRTEVTYSVLMNPAGTLPDAVAGMLTKNLTMKTLLGIKEKAKRNRDPSVRPDPAKGASGKDQQP